MKNKKGFILSTYVYILLVFFLLILSTMLAVLNNTRILSNKLKEQSSNTSGLINKDFSFVMLGDKGILLRKGEDFIDPGFIIKSSGGVDLSNIVKVTDSINNDVIGNYERIYTATYNGVTKELKRIVHVVDNNASNYLTALYEYKSNDNGLIKDDTVDKNIRYSGNYVKNYVEFGNDNELWRIIGIFNVTTASGKTEKLMKIVRNDLIGAYSWDSSTGNNDGAHTDGEVNDGYGVNQWGASTYTDGSAYEGADLMRELNTLYLNQESGTCYNGSSNASTTCNFSTTGIKDTYRGMIESVVWNTGAFSWGQSAKTAYQAERGTTTGQICKGTTYQNGAYCTDTVKRTTTWEGRVGLIYPSDYGYGSTNTSCRNNINDNTNFSCKNDNWLHNNTYYWTLSPFAPSDHSNDAWLVVSGGFVDGGYARGGYGVRPSVYLKSDVSITSGDGSSNNPYKLSVT